MEQYHHHQERDCNMGKQIREIYRKAGVKAPKGKGIHKKKFHEVAVAVKKKNPGWTMNRAYATAMSTLGRNRSVKKSHQR